MTRRLFHALALVLLGATAARPARSAAQEAPPSADSLPARIDRVFARLARQDSPGCAVGVGRGGRTLYAHGYGSANLEYDVPITSGTIFESGSVAKQFTASAIVLLAQDGRLSLDDDVRRWVPEVPDFGERITLRHLLTHTSGLRDQWGLLAIEGRGPGTQVHSPATTVDLVAHQKALNFPPGAEYLYSNTGFTLLGVVVERASGKSLDAFTRERLFRPLGMTHTQWRDDFTRVVRDRATAYSGGGGRDGFHTDMPFTNIVGNGGLLTTVGDLLTWNENLDHPRVGGASYVQAMETRAHLRSGREITYALGLEVTSYDGVREVSHGGSTAGYRTWLARYPEQGVSIAVLCNLASANPTSLGHQVADLLLRRPPRAAQSGTPAVALGPDALARWRGIWVNRATDELMRFEDRDGRLVLGNAPALAVTPLADDRVRTARGDELQLAPAAQPRALRAIGSDGDTAVYVEAPAWRDGAHLSDFVGTYASDELDVKLVVAERDGHLVLSRRPADAFEMRPQYADDFLTPLGALHFDRDANGRVTGFGIYAGRVRNVRFGRR